MNTSLDDRRPRSARFPSVISFPVLMGMTYPQLESEGLTDSRGSRGHPCDATGTEERDTCSNENRYARMQRGVGEGAAKFAPRRVSGHRAGPHRPARLTDQGVHVRSVGEALTEDEADLAVPLVQATTRNMLQADAFVQSVQWPNGRCPVGHSLVGAIIGIGGLSGGIGQAICWLDPSDWRNKMLRRTIESFTPTKLVFAA